MTHLLVSISLFHLTKSPTFYSLSKSFLSVFLSITRSRLSESIFILRFFSVFQNFLRKANNNFLFSNFQHCVIYKFLSKSYIRKCIFTSGSFKFFNIFWNFFFFFLFLGIYQESDVICCQQFHTNRSILESRIRLIVDNTQF